MTYAPADGSIALTHSLGDDPAVEELRDAVARTGAEVELHQLILLSHEPPLYITLAATALSWAKTGLGVAATTYVGALATCAATEHWTNRKEIVSRARQAIADRIEPLANVIAVCLKIRNRFAKVSFAIETENATIAVRVLDDECGIDELARAIALSQKISASIALITDRDWPAMRTGVKLTPRGYVITYRRKSDMTIQHAEFDDEGSLLSQA